MVKHTVVSNKFDIPFPNVIYFKNSRITQNVPVGTV